MNIFRGLPEGFNTNISIPFVEKNGKKFTINYKDKAFLPNSSFPVELYEYRRDSELKLSLDGKVVSKFASKNLADNIYKNKDMKEKITRLIDHCRQNMKNEFEQETDDEIRFHEATDDDEEKKSLEYKYDLYETVKAFNDYLCITFLHLCNILTFPNETFYERYSKNQIRIKPEDAMKMANVLCKRLQEEFENVITEIYPIQDTVKDIIKSEKKADKLFQEDVVTIEKKKKKK